MWFGWGYHPTPKSPTPRALLRLLRGQRLLGMFLSLSLLVSALLLRAPHTFTVSRAHAVASAAASAVDVVVVGGGPAGLAAATDLASAGLSVTVVERRETASAFEMQRAYLYLLDRRGQQWTDRHDLTATVRERGVVKQLCGKRGGSDFGQLAPRRLPCSAKSRLRLPQASARLGQQVAWAA